jgi:hypothetical protein
VLAGGRPFGGVFIVRSLSAARVASSISATRARAGFAIATALIATLLPFATAPIGASTPVTAGYRDFDFGTSAGANRRATGDKPQSKLWFTDGTWWAGMFNPEPTTKWKIYRLDTAAQDWVSTGVTIDDRDQSHGDYLWDEANHKLYVASAHATDNIRVYRYSYNPTTNTYAADDLNGANAGVFITIPGSATETATIARDSTGQIWVTYTKVSTDVDPCADPSDPTPRKLADVMVATSSNWAAPFVLPSQGTARPTSDDIAAVIAFGSGTGASVGVMYNAQGCLATGGDHLYFSVHSDSQSDSTWTAKQTVASGTEAADDHMNLKYSPASGRLFAISKTGKDKNPNLDFDEINLYERSSGGTWTKHLVSQVRENQTRPQVLIDDSHERVYAFLAATEHADGGKVFVKSATFDELDADSPSTPAFATGFGADFIASTSDPLINDPTTTKQVVSHSTGVVVLASDRTTHMYLHNGFPIAAVDATAPVGSLSINGGAAITTDADVDLNVIASDPESAITEVDVANGTDPSAGTTFAYAEHIPWTLPGGDGPKTVSVRWHNAAGRTSTDSVTITLDTAPPPTGTVTIAGGAAEIGGVDTTVGVTKPSDASDITHVRLSNDDATWTTFAYAATIPWRLASGADGPRTVFAQWRDGAGHWSVSASDGIAVNSLVLPPPAGVVKINNGAKATKSTSVTVSISKPAADVTKMRLASSLSGLGSATWINYASTKTRTLSSTNGTKRVYVQWRDSTGKVSPAANDSIILDRVLPTASAPRATFATGRSVGATLPVLISWSGSDSLSGIRRFTLYRSINGGSYQVVTLATPTTRSIVLGLSKSRTYRFAVRNVDWAGNVSLRKAGPLLHPVAVQENSSAIHYSSGWHISNSSSYYGGHARWSSTKGAKATYRVYGRSAGIVSALGPTRGTMQIYVNGVLKQTISLYSAVTRTRRVVARLTWSTLNYRTITIRVVGTTGHARVDLDAILVLR